MPSATGTGAQPTRLLDTSAAVAHVVGDQLGPRHHHRGRAAAPLGLAGHAWFETYSVLTRLPGALRRSPADAARLLAHNFPESAFLSEAATAAPGTELAERGIAGGSLYDALVAAAARHHDRPLLTLDARPAATYAALGVSLETPSEGFTRSR